MKTNIRSLAFLSVIVAVVALCPLESLAQVPARFYWKTLSGANATPVIVQSMSGNSNPFDPAHLVTPGATFDATLILAGYARMFSLGDRSAMIAILEPMGRITGDLTVAGLSTKQSSSGFGDPMVEFDINIIGPKAQKSIPDAVRYQPGFSVDLLGDLAIPIGQYDHNQQINLSQHRWYGRIGAPIVWQLGPWIPGKRTTLEVLPAVWLAGTNDDFVGQSLSTDPLFQLDGHLSRDFTDHFWASLDTAWFKGAGSSINGVSGKGRDDFAMGFTAGYKINDNLGFTVGYKSTINDNSPDSLRMSQFMVSVTYGWHKIIEGMNRLKRN